MKMPPSTRASPGTSKSGTKPPALRKRDGNRQTQLNATVRPPAAAPARPLVQHASVIVLSSDDEADGPYVPPAAVTRKRVGVAGPGTKGKARDGKDGKDEKEKEAESSVLARLRVEKEEIKRECERYKGLCYKEQVSTARATAEKDKVLLRVKEMEKNLKRKASTAFPDYSDLDDSTSCEICTNRMWQPATLRECGHTFCESCLHDWFNTTYTQHVDAHPAFLEGPQIPLHYLAHEREPAIAAAIEAMKTEWKRRVPQPVYTCPTCRGPVRKRPLEIFFVKDIVRKVAKVTDGERGAKSPGREGRASRAVGSIWDGFFPKK